MFLDMDNDSLKEYKEILKWNCGMLIKRKERARKCKMFQKWNSLYKIHSKQHLEKDSFNSTHTDVTRFSHSGFVSNSLFSSSFLMNQQLQRELDRLKREQIKLMEETTKAKESLQFSNYSSKIYKSQIHDNSQLSNTGNTYFSQI